MSNNTTAVSPQQKTLAIHPTMGTLLRFFIPLGFAACLVSITHTIIHSMLSKAAHPEIAIATFAIGMSFSMLTERPAVLIRQTCSALVRDRLSFRAMASVTWLLIAGSIAFGAVICYTPVGVFIFREMYGVDEAIVPAIVSAYQFFMWVGVFSAIRCLYHGVIISQMRTKWVTIGMIVRLIGMFAIAQFLIHTGRVDGGAAGALLFAAGMLIEAAVCYAEGRTLVRRYPERLEKHTVTSKRHVFGFYRPLLHSSFIAVTIQPAINALLGQTVDVELSIASFAVATSVYNVISSAFTYIHQIVLSFYQTSPKLVQRFQRVIGFTPCITMAAICWSPAGPFILAEIMGLSGQLLTATHNVMKAFVLIGLVFPWLDYGNGFLMLYRRTNVFLWSQLANAITGIALLVLMIAFVPHWNGVIGALAMAAGFGGELAVVAYALFRQREQLGFQQKLPERRPREM